MQNNFKTEYLGTYSNFVMRKLQVTNIKYNTAHNNYLKKYNLIAYKICVQIITNDHVMYVSYSYYL